MGRHPQRFDPDVAAWRIILAALVFALYCAVRSLFSR